MGRPLRPGGPQLPDAGRWRAPADRTGEPGPGSNAPGADQAGEEGQRQGQTRRTPHAAAAIAERVHARTGDQPVRPGSNPRRTRTRTRTVRPSGRTGGRDTGGVSRSGPGGPSGSGRASSPSSSTATCCRNSEAMGPAANIVAGSCSRRPHYLSYDHHNAPGETRAQPTPAGEIVPGDDRRGVRTHQVRRSAARSAGADPAARRHGARRLAPLSHLPRPRHRAEGQDARQEGRRPGRSHLAELGPPATQPRPAVRRAAEDRGGVPASRLRHGSGQGRCEEATGRRRASAEAEVQRGHRQDGRCEPRDGRAGGPAEEAVPEVVRGDG